MSILSADSLVSKLSKYLASEAAGPKAEDEQQADYEIYIQHVLDTLSIPEQVNDILCIVAEWLNQRNRQEMSVGFRFSGENAASEINEALRRYSSGS